MDTVKKTRRHSNCPYKNTVHHWQKEINKKLTRERLDPRDGHLRSFSEVLDDVLRVHAVLNEGLALAEELPGEDDDGRGSVSDFRVLRLRDVHQGFGRRVHDVEELHDRGAVVGDGGGAAVIVYELVQSARALWRDGWTCGEREWG